MEWWEGSILHRGFYFDKSLMCMSVFQASFSPAELTRSLLLLSQHSIDHSAEQTQLPSLEITTVGQCGFTDKIPKP